jgi:oligoribonuclease
MSKMFWVDMETSGLDAMKQTSLEVGTIVTDEWGNEIARFSAVRTLDRRYYESWVTNVDQFVVDMHEKSGLWQDCFDSEKTKFEITVEWTEWLLKQGLTNKHPMCGSSVWFDRSFINIDFPSILPLFSYRQIDVSSHIETMRLVNPALASKLDEANFKREEHRVLPDIEDSIAGYCWLVDNFFHSAPVDADDATS